jgi:hypothetical protein
MADTNFGSFQDLLALTPENLRPLMSDLKELILKVDPDTVEVVRLGDRAATYGVGPRKMKEGYVYIMPHKAWVNLGFYKGSSLPDPGNLLEGTGKQLRHIKIHKREMIGDPRIKTLIQQAFEERKRATV